MSLWLTREELETRTGYKRLSKMRIELARQGVKFTTRRDGFPLVDRALFEVPPAKSAQRKEPNFAALRGA